jgi:hypothetical protein
LAISQLSRFKQCGAGGWLGMLRGLRAYQELSMTRDIVQGYLGTQDMEVIRT